MPARRTNLRVIKGTKGPDSLEAIAERLRRLRQLKHRSQAELCRRTGIAPNTWNQYEMGKSRPVLDKAILLVDAYEVSLDWIYFGKEAGLPKGLADALSRPPTLV